MAKRFYVFFILIICALPIFLDLGKLSLRLWDEARVANNAIEMFFNGNYLVSYFDGNPEMWNTKPPFLLWWQVLSMKVFGINELAIRLPSAISAFFLVILLMVFSIKVLKNELIGFVAPLILVCSFGYLDNHIARSCDYDSMLCFLSALYGLFYFKYLEDFKTRYLVIATLGIIFAVLTKTIMGIFLLPAMFVYTIYQKKFFVVFKSYKIYIALFSIFFVTAVYYLLREHATPGYISAVIQFDLTGRYIGGGEGHHYGYFYYFNELRNIRFSPWFYLIPISFLLGILQKNAIIKRITIYSFLIIFLHLLILSFSKTKLLWYDSLFFPFGSILVAIGLSQLYLILKEFFKIKDSFRMLMLFVLFWIPIFLPAYERSIRQVYNPIYGDNELRLRYGYYFNRIKNENLEIKNYTVLVPNKYNAALDFYIKSFNFKGFNIVRKNYEANMEEGEIVLTDNTVGKSYIEKQYVFSVLDSWEEFVLVKIDRRL